MSNILQFKDRKKAEQMRDQYSLQGYDIVTNTDDTIVMERGILKGALAWVVAILFFPIGLLVFIKKSVSIVIDAPATPVVSNLDKYAELAILEDLRAKGILTDDEYQAKKRVLLA